MTRAGAVAACAAVALAAGAAVTWNDMAGPTGGRASLALDGANLFRARGCASCHAGPDSTPQFMPAPSLADARTRASTRRPGVSSRDYLAQSILVPSAFISPAFRAGAAGPLEAMPDLHLSSAEVDVLVTYLLSR